MSETSKGKIVQGLFWSYAERILAQLISVIISVVLARLLTPEDYGIISIVMIFISLCNALVTGGLGNSLVQKKDADDLDFNTMLICSISFSIVLYSILFGIAPFIAEFYHIPLLTPVIRVLSLRIPLSGINSIQHAKIQKDFAFRKFFYATLIGTIISAVVGIIMAYQGFGVWALVAQYLTNTAIDTVVLFVIHRWKINFHFSLRRAKVLLRFGWKLLSTTVVYTLEANFRSLIIGKAFSSADLAYYDQGKKIPDLLVTNINSSIAKVMLPALANQQDNKIALKNMCRKAGRVGTYLLMPVLVGLMAIAEPLVSIVFTDKWLPCVPYVRVMALLFVFRPLCTTCQQALLALGRSDIILKIEIIINVVAITTVCVAVFIIESVFFIAIGALLAEVVGLMLFLYYVKTLIGYSLREQISDFAAILVLNTFMGFAVYMVGMLNTNPIALMIMQVFIGGSIYFGGSVILKVDVLLYLLNTLHLSRMNKLYNCIVLHFSKTPAE